MPRSEDGLYNKGPMDIVDQANGGNNVAIANPCVQLCDATSMDFSDGVRYVVSKDDSTSDGQVQEFLKVQMQENDEVLGYPEGLKSLDTVVLSGRSEHTCTVDATRN